MNRGLQHHKKSFQTGGEGDDIKIRHGLTDEQAAAEKEKTSQDTQASMEQPSPRNKTKRIIPFGNRILVKRQRVGQKLGSGILVATDETSERLTELAEVVFVPDMTFADHELMANGEAIIKALTEQICKGDTKGIDALFKFKEYLNIKALKPGDKVFIGKYVGTDFCIGETGEQLTIMNPEDIRGMVLEIN